MLSVAGFKKKVRRTTEKSFEDLFAEVLTEKQIYSRHMSDKFSGVPDRYIGGGTWVELKSLDYARGVVPYAAGMSVEQKRVCSELITAEEEVWYLALVTTNKGQFVIFCPMHVVLPPGDHHWQLNIEGSGCGWVHPYKGKATIREIIPKDWYI